MRIPSSLQQVSSRRRQRDALEKVKMKTLELERATISVYHLRHNDGGITRTIDLDVMRE